jgi:hypothetical protein
MSTKKQRDTIADGGPLIVEIAHRIGELSGTNSAVLSEIGRLNQELIRLGNELDKKHEENISRIEIRHRENEALLQAHTKDDSQNFAKIFRYFNYVSGAIGLAMVIWAIVKVIVPLLVPVRLGE